MADYMIEGVCRYCGQAQTLKCSDELTGLEADEYISGHCICEESRRFRAGIEVSESIKKLFGQECARYGFAAESAGTMRDISEIRNMIDRLEITEAQIKVPSGDTVKFKIDVDGNVSITRILKKQKSI